MLDGPAVQVIQPLRTLMQRLPLFAGDGFYIYYTAFCRVVKGGDDILVFPRTARGDCAEVCCWVMYACCSVLFC